MNREKVNKGKKKERNRERKRQDVSKDRNRVRNLEREGRDKGIYRDRQRNKGRKMKQVNDKEIGDKSKKGEKGIK